jgi:hypothetical protein
MELKLTPLILFFIILLVLVVSAIYMNRFKHEGFIDFNAAASAKDGTASLTVPLYSTNSPLNKLYDNIYIDKRNANLVTLDGPSSGTQSTDPTTLYSINVLSRNSNYNSIVSYTNSKASITNYDSNESKSTSIAESYQSSTVHTNPPSEYQIFYFAWNRDTYLHVMDLTKKTHVVSYCMDSTSAITTYDLSANGPTKAYPAMNIKTTVSDASDNKTSTITLYDPTNPVYQLHTNIFYDSLRGYVICTKMGANNVIGVNNVYDYAGNDLYNAAVNASNPLLTNPPTSPTRISSLVASSTPFASVAFTSTVVNGDASNNVLILSNTNKKIIAHISADVNSRPVITNYLKFNGQKIDTSVASATSTSSSPVVSMIPTDVSMNNPRVPIDSDKVYDEYMKWYTYWNSVGQPGNKGFSDDYLLKTQIVPPVCPACNTVGGCTNCNAGGSSYSGSKGSGGSGASTGSSGGSATSATSTGAGSGTGTVIAHADGKTETVAATTAKQLTTVDRGGALASTADPDTLGGSLTLGQLSFVAGLQDVGHVIGDTADNAVNKIGQGVGAIGQGIGSAGSGIYNTVNAAGQGVYSAGQGIGGAVENTGSYLGGALNNVGGAISNVGSTAYEAGKYVGTGVGGAIHDVGSTAYDAGKYVGTGVASGIKKIGDEIDEHEDRYGNQRGSYRGSDGNGGGNGSGGSNSNIMNNGNINGTGYKDNYYDPSRQAYNNSYRGATTNAAGQYTGTDIDQYSYYGALQSKGGNFMPLTSDFSKFGR